MIAVTGATGGVGGRVAQALASQGLALRLVVRDAARAPGLGAEVAEAQYRDGAAMRAAFEGAQTVYLVSASESADRVAEHISAVDAAAAAGVERIVYVSFMGAAPDAVFTFARDHAATEARIRSTWLAHVFLRSCMYAEYVPLLASAEGVIQGPAGDGRAAFVSRDDVADVAAAVLAAPAEHDGRTYDVTGPEALNLDEAAAILSEAAGRAVVYERETLEQARESRRPSGAPDWEIEGWVTSYAALPAGDLEPPSDTVRQILDRPPRSLADVLREQPGRLAHLRR
ncbi:MAG TPA: NAD(P)H-binding protein [Solirubrobacteraceae bacterium]|nr:NAD(P)H-binding protein [Solirubrobacteraceae bacterium]